MWFSWQQSFLIYSLNGLVSRSGRVSISALTTPRPTVSSPLIKFTDLNPLVLYVQRLSYIVTFPGRSGSCEHHFSRDKGNYSSLPALNHVPYMQGPTEKEIQFIPGSHGTGCFSKLRVLRHRAIFSNCLHRIVEWLSGTTHTFYSFNLVVFLN